MTHPTFLVIEKYKWISNIKQCNKKGKHGLFIIKMIETCDRQELMEELMELDDAPNS